MKTKYVIANVIGMICLLTVCFARVAHAQGPTDRCNLLTQAAINAATGVNVGKGTPIATMGCSWQPEKPHVIVFATLMGPAMAGVCQQCPAGHVTP